MDAQFRHLNCGKTEDPDHDCGAKGSYQRWPCAVVSAAGDQRHWGPRRAQPRAAQGPKRQLVRPLDVFQQNEHGPGPFEGFGQIPEKYPASLHRRKRPVKFAHGEVQLAAGASPQPERRQVSVIGPAVRLARGDPEPPSPKVLDESGFAYAGLAAHHHEPGITGQTTLHGRDELCPLATSSD